MPLPNTTKARQTVRPKSSMTRQLVIHLALTVVAVSVLFILVQYAMESRESMRALERRAEEYSAGLKKSLELPLWNFDRKTVLQIGASYLLNDAVVEIHVTDSTSLTIANIRKTYTGATIERSADIYHQGQFVGRVVIALSPQYYQSINRKLLWSSMATVLLVVLAMTVASGLIVRHILRTPLNHLRRMVDHYAAGDYDPSPGTPTTAEFQPFVSLLGEMGDRIKTQLSELKQAEEKYRTIFENAAEGIFQLSPKGRLLSANPAMARIMGFDSPERLMWEAQTAQDQIFSDVEKLRDFIGRLREKGRVSGYEINLRRGDGRNIWISLSVLTVLDEEGAPVRYEGTLMDVTLRRQAEEALRESEERYRALFENAPTGIGVSSMDGKVLAFNPKMAEIFGYSEEEFFTIRVLDTFRYPEDAPRLRQTLKENGRVQDYEAELVRKDGTPFHVSMNLQIVTILGEKAVLNIATDITERKKAEEERERLRLQLQQAQKMEAVGTLAGGIAHDFNNILMSIAGYASLMEVGMAPDHPHYSKVQTILDQVQSASGLTKQLLGVASGGKYEVKPTDINQVVQNTADMFGRTRKDIRILKYFQDPLWTAEVDRVQMEQVFLNLFVNAWQAMPEGGELRLATENVEMDDRFAGAYDLQPGRYVKISVTDTGIGMDENTRRRVFDPFFTTKGMGRGTGLGLASAYGIVRNHGGIISVYSEINLGATFNVYLPASDKAPEADVFSPETLRLGHETILLVDDEELIAEVGGEMLETLGYKPLIACNGPEALETYKKHRGAVSLVLLDLVMPGMGGGRTFELLKEIDPDVRVILSSGYSLNGQAQEIMSRGCAGFIQKPFRLKELSEKIRLVLDDHQTAAPGPVEAA